ncbi:hypothetical protein SAMN05216232_1955 [Virgibacillus subterraneus]|uniref:Uncharacterized protein n=1 Tax=Virgibacillus subterraneus TaxID=621109 RepID=A0A1H9EA74_9BACI|nr:hypothetical protein [Virgibacillus subterraneus]SEQ22591.1 hypothetical protein SAMN05216232_1955 [Virgibacillus subterraneus]
MTEEERDSLFEQMRELPEDNKTSILSRLFGLAEARNKYSNENIHPEEIFKRIQEQVDMEAETK